MGVPERTLLVLSTDSVLIGYIKRVSSGMTLSSIPCLKTADLIRTSFRFIIDPRAVCGRCLQNLTASRDRISRNRVVFLSMQAPPHLLLKLAQACPGVVASPRTVLAHLGRSGYCGASSYAWEIGAGILNPDRVSETIRALITLAKEHSRHRYTVAAAAHEMGVSPRQLGRLCKASIGLSPHLVIKLARVARVAECVIKEAIPLEEIAERHGYPDLPTMSRQFRHLVGEPPGRYRRRHKRPWGV